MINSKALSTVLVASKAKRLKALWPEIQQKLAAGASHDSIRQALKEDGLDLSERTYKSYVYRLRKAQREGACDLAVQAAPRERAASTDTLTPSGGPRAGGPKRPRTFDYDPSGIPDLLK